MTYIPGADQGGVTGVVRISGGAKTQYPTIAAALAAAGAGDVVLVGPGSYAESALVVPAGVTLESAYVGEATIAGAAATGTRVTLMENAVLRGFRIVAPTDAGSAGVLSSSPSQAIARCVFLGQGPGTLGTCIVNSGGLQTSDLVYLGGECGFFLQNTGSALVQSITFLAGTITCCVHVIAGNVEAGPLRFVNAFTTIDAVAIDGGASLFSNDAIFESAVTNAVHIMGDSANVDFRAPRFVSPGLNILVDAGVTVGRLEIVAGVGNRDAIDAPAVYLQQPSVTLSFQDNRPGDEAFLFFAEVAVGTPDFGREMAVGEGDSYTREMVVLRSPTDTPAGPFTDITANLRLPTGPTEALFPGVGAGGTCYFGVTRKFPNLVTDVATAMVVGGGSVVWEYWNGGAWVAFDVMAAQSSAPHGQFGNTPFERAERDQVRFDNTIDPSWAAVDVGGFGVLFWVRARIDVDITTAPIANQIKIGPNRTEINADGFEEYIGTGEKLAILLWHRRLEDDLSGQSPGNVALSLATGITITPIDNNFQNGASDGNGGVISIPPGLDTSRRLQYIVSWIPNNNSAGDVELELSYALVKAGDTLDGTIAATTVTEVISVNGQANELQVTTLDIRIPQAVPGNRLAIAFRRDATAGNPDDTFVGNVEVVDAELRGDRWT